MAPSPSRKKQRKTLPSSAELNLGTTSPTAKSNPSLRSPVFVICPGASSKEPTEMKEALESMSTMGYPSTCTRVLTKWKGIHPSKMGANVQVLLDLCVATAKEFPDRPMYLAGHSFGTRVIIALLTKIHKQKSRMTVSPDAKEDVNGDDNEDSDEDEIQIPHSLDIHHAILESYPLYGPSPPKPATDRVIPLMKCPSNLWCLFFSGEKDEFLDRSDKWRGNAKIGGEALREVVAKMPNAKLCTIATVEKGKHNALKGSKTYQADVYPKFQTAVAQLLGLGDDSCLKPSSETDLPTTGSEKQKTTKKRARK